MSNRFECTPADILNADELPTCAAIALQRELLLTHTLQRGFCLNSAPQNNVPVNPATVAHGLGVWLVETVTDETYAVGPYIELDGIDAAAKRGFALYVQRPTEDDTIN